ncbi:MAG: DNA translocase FtsK [Lentisphaerae bacterium]|nr:DNA translocase FtsK [Lentisphaerota bacterium]
MAERKPSSGGMRQFLGIILATLGILAALGFFSYDWEDISYLRAPPNDPPLNYIGPAGAWFSFVALMSFGYAAFLFPLFFMALGMLLMFRPEDPVPGRLSWGIVVVLACSGLLQMHPEWFSGLNDQFNISGIEGGLFGLFAGKKACAGLLGSTGANVVAIGFLVGGTVLFIGMPAIMAGFRNFWAWIIDLRNRREARLDARRDEIERLARQEREVARQADKLEKELRRKNRDKRTTRRDEPETIRPAPTVPDREPEPEPVPAPAPEPEPAAPPQPANGERKKPAQQDEEPFRRKPDKPAKREQAPKDTPLTSGEGRWELPASGLLLPIPPESERFIKGDFQTTSHVLQETLKEFNIECEVKSIEQGPVVTRYEMLPAAGVKLEKIAALQSNIALALKATSIRIQAPIPGKGLVGVEVPNATSTKVVLRELVESDSWQHSRANLPLVLGKDVGGKDIMADLATMPHLLIAGATGSGKTVCMNSILIGLLMSRTPDQMRLMLVDPKIVEFNAYRNLPHLVVPVITESKKVQLGLRWAINEMEKRYKLFARAGVRNISSFNSRPKPVIQPELPLPPPQPAAADQASGDIKDAVEKQAAESGAAGEEPIPERVPYIVVVIDELADLMLEAKADIEMSIARLAQLSRATGIHLILATQRPSVNVITGTIKANFPARISFQVAQKVDSRTILDTGGAEKLLGRGDMLFLPPGTSKLIRAQGAFTTDEEIGAITDFWRRKGEPHYETSIKASMESAAPSGGQDEEVDDEMVEQSIAIIRETRRASTSMLQRRLRIGYNRAGRLMDILEDKGIVGPPNGSNPREILIDLDGEIPQNTGPGDNE